MAQDRLDERTDLEAAVDVGAGERGDDARGRRHGNEVAPQLRDEERGVERVLDTQPAAVAPIEVATLPEDRLCALIVQVGVESEVAGTGAVPVVGPTRQRPRLLVNVALCVGAAVRTE